MADRTWTHSVFADYFQFYVADASADFSDLADGWSQPAAQERRFVQGNGYVAIGTARNMDVPVTLRLLDQDPGDPPDLPDRTNIGRLNVTSGIVRLLGVNDVGVRAFDIPVPVGRYQLRAIYRNQDRLSADGLEGEDTYEVELWPSGLETADLRRIFELVTAAIPGVTYQHLAGAGDIWEFRLPGERYDDCQIESAAGDCPFSIEGFDTPPRTGRTPEEVAAAVVATLEKANRAVAYRVERARSAADRERRRHRKAGLVRLGTGGAIAAVGVGLILFNEPPRPDLTASVVAMSLWFLVAAAVAWRGVRELKASRDIAQP